MPAPPPAAGPPPSWRELLTAWRWPLAALAALLILCTAGYLVYRETLRQVGNVAEVVGDVVQRREVGRRVVAEFVRTRLLREKQWGSGGVAMIRVVFPDEAGIRDAGPLEESLLSS